MFSCFYWSVCGRAMREANVSVIGDSSVMGICKRNLSRPLLR